MNPGHSVKYMIPIGKKARLLLYKASRKSKFRDRGGDGRRQKEMGTHCSEGGASF